MRVFLLFVSVIDHAFDVLHQLASAVHIQRLQTVTDSQNRFARMVGLAEQEIIYRIASGIVGIAPGIAGSLVFTRVNVRAATRQQHPVAALDDLFDLVFPLSQFNSHRLAARFLDRALVMRQGSPGIFTVMMRDRNGNARLHWFHIVPGAKQNLLRPLPND